MNDEQLTRLTTALADLTTATRILADANNRLADVNAHTARIQDDIVAGVMPLVPVIVERIKAAFEAETDAPSSQTGGLEGLDISGPEGSVKVNPVLSREQCDLSWKTGVKYEHVNELGNSVPSNVHVCKLPMRHAGNHRCACGRTPPILV